jgi:glutamate formiminotransferase / formiminotetrahydrofolate cyclodeaminase
MAILECIPNFSEGRDSENIKAIASAIRKVKDVKLLHIDSGFDANRTVITFAGSSEAVFEAAFQAVKKAAEVIDMRIHKGVHPRFGATDVLPLVPISGITMDETIALARKLGERIGNELGIHVYCYENAAFDEKRKNLATCRAGEYEGLPAKLNNQDWKPDFGPVVFNARSGAVAVGARDFLIAYNVNLATDDVKIAKTIAADIRESGRIGDKQKRPGMFKGLKAIGWYLPEHHKVQVSTNITDITQSPVHLVFEEISRRARIYGTTVTGSELIGLIPLKVMAAAGRYYISKNNLGMESEKNIIQQAIDHLGLNELTSFYQNERILEFLLTDEI